MQAPGVAGFGASLSLDSGTGPILGGFLRRRAGDWERLSDTGCGLSGPMIALDGYRGVRRVERGAFAEGVG